jgi:uncharacterized membrane protein
VSTTRLEAFSDGVFAVAITLLALDLVNFSGRKGELGSGLLDYWPHYATFAVTFVTIGIIWVNHHAQWERIAHVDRPLLFLNLLLLMFVVLIPFPTSLLARYLHGSDQHVAAAVYSGVLLAMGLAFFAVWFYTARHPSLLHIEIGSRELRLLVRRNIIGLLPYAVAFGLAFLSAAASLALCALVAVYYVLPERLPEHPGAQPPRA